MSIKINPRTLTTVSGLAQTAGAKTILAAKVGARPFVVFSHVILGTHTSATIDFGGTAVMTVAADSTTELLLIGDAGDIVELTYVGVASDGEHAITCGYLGEPASDISKDLT
jgi:hypothetical protein